MGKLSMLGIHPPNGLLVRKKKAGIRLSFDCLQVSRWPAKPFSISVGISRKSKMAAICHLSLDCLQISKWSPKLKMVAKTIFNELNFLVKSYRGLTERVWQNSITYGSSQRMQYGYTSQPPGQALEGEVGLGGQESDGS